MGLSNNQKACFCLRLLVKEIYWTELFFCLATLIKDEKIIVAMILFKNFLFIFNWRIIALQYCVGFCHISTWISHRYTYVPSLLKFPPISTWSQPSRFLQSTGLSSLSHTANSHWLFILHMIVYMLPCCSLHLSHPLLPPLLCPQLFSMSVSPLLPCK